MAHLIRLLSQFKISSKLIGLPFTLILIIVTLGSLSGIRLTALDNEVQSITRDLAPDAGAASTLLERMFLMRLAVKDYARNGNQSNEARFRQRSQDFDQAFVQTQDRIQSTVRRQILRDIDSLKQQYTQLFFTQVVTFSNQVDTIQTQQLDMIGPRFIDDINRRLETANSQESAVLSNAKTAMLSARLAVFKYRQQSQQQQYDLAIRLLNRIIDTTKNNQFIGLAKKATDYKTAFSQLAQVTEQKLTAIDEMDTIGPAMASLAVDLSNSVFDSLDDKGTEVENSVSHTLSTIVTLTALATLFGVAFSYIIAQGILRPIRKTSAMLEDIAKGEGDLTQRLDIIGNDEIANLSRYFNNFIASIQTLVGEIQSAAYQIGSASEELSVVSMQTSNTVSAQSRALEHAGQVKDNLVQADQDVASRSDDAMQNTDDANQEASRVEKAVVESVSGIRDLANNLNGSKAVIEQLSHDSDRIGQVLTIITSITEQINLLALNAAIEAARAGEAGRGFAVVADEVRTLAQRTQESTAEIEASINSVISISKKASQTIDNSLHVANEVADSSDEMQQQLASAISLISASNSSNQGIRQATEKKRAYLTNLVEQLDSVSLSLTDSQQSAKQSSEASEELAKLGAQLQTLVDSFKV